MAMTLLNDKKLPPKFWAKAINTACYIWNICLERTLFGKTAYELYHGKISSIFHYKVFGSKCYIHNTKDQVNKFDSKIQNGIFLRYSLNS